MSGKLCLRNLKVSRASRFRRFLETALAACFFDIANPNLAVDSELVRYKTVKYRSANFSARSNTR
jgi:hypothetical protein